MEQGELMLYRSPAEWLRARFDDGTYPADFWAWLELNEHILHHFCQLAIETHDAGVTRWSADAICHVLRWQTAIREHGHGMLKINDHCTAGLARLAMRLHPKLEGFFTTRAPPGRDDYARVPNSRPQPEEIRRCL